MDGVYRFAGLTVRIHSVYDDVHQLCKEYRADGIPCFAVQTGPEDIAFEREASARRDLREGRERTVYSEAYLETLAVYRGLAERLPEYGGFVFHGSAMAVDGRGYVWAAPGGTGKSTHARLWRELLKDRAVMINDDKPVIRFREGVPFVCGTPWDGKHRLSSPAEAPLQALCLLERGRENRIREITAREALPGLLRQTYRPRDPAALKETVALLGRLKVRYYLLQCNMEPEAAEVSWRAMKGEDA